MLILELLGTLSLRDETRPVPVAAQQKRPLGLLAILGLGGKPGLSRDRIEAYLWPESSGARAQHALDQTVYAIRHALGSDVILATARELRLNPELVRVDVWEFEQAIRASQWTAAVGHYKGPLLDGFHFADSHELDSWIESNRARLRLEYQKALEFLANLAAEASDHSQAVMWLRRLANSDPLSAGATKKLMLALAAAGDRAGAVQYARVYQELVTRARDGAGFRDRRSRRVFEPSRDHRDRRPCCVSAHSIGHAVRRHFHATRQRAQPSRQDGVVRRDRARHSDFCWRDLGLAAPRTGEAGSAIHAGDRLERGNGSQYGLVGTGCHLP